MRRRHYLVTLVCTLVTTLIAACGSSGDYLFDPSVGTEDAGGNDGAGGGKLDGSNPNELTDARLMSLDARVSMDVSVTDGSVTDGSVTDAKMTPVDVGVPCNPAQCTTPPNPCYATPGFCGADAGGKCAYAFKTAGLVCTGGMCDGTGICMSMPDAGVAGED